MDNYGSMPGPTKINATNIIINNVTTKIATETNVNNYIDKFDIEEIVKQNIDRIPCNKNGPFTSLMGWATHYEKTLTSQTLETIQILYNQRREQKISISSSILNEELPKEIVEDIIDHM